MRVLKDFIKVIAGSLICCGLVAAMILFTDHYAHTHGASNGEHSWQYSFILLKPIPLSLLTGLFHLPESLGATNVFTISLLQAIATGLFTMPIFLALGAFIQYVIIGAFRNEK